MGTAAAATVTVKKIKEGAVCVCVADGRGRSSQKILLGQARWPSRWRDHGQKIAGSRNQDFRDPPPSIRIFFSCPWPALAAATVKKSRDNREGRAHTPVPGQAWPPSPSWPLQKKKGRGGRRRRPLTGVTKIFFMLEGVSENRDSFNPVFSVCRPSQEK